MQLEVIFTGDSITRDIVDHQTVVVIDALRATSTMVTAIAHGAEKIIPCYTPDEAFQLLDCEEKDLCLLGGERKGNIIPGFYLGNSPLGYSKEKVAGKTIIMTTTNGTKAILNSTGAKLLLLGSFLNSGAVARIVREQKDHVIFACAGTGGRFSYDDVLAAGSIIDKVCRNNPEPIMADSAFMSLEAYRTHKKNLAEMLLHTFHGKRLSSIGFKQDIEFCAREDLFSVVPFWNNGVIRAFSRDFPLGSPV